MKWVLIGGSAVYLFCGCVMNVLVWLTHFSIIHEKLEKENFQNGVPLIKHVAMVDEEMKRTAGLRFNFWIILFFWPYHLGYLRRHSWHLDRSMDAVFKDGNS